MTEQKRLDIVGLDVHKDTIAVAVALPGRSKPKSLGIIVLCCLGHVEEEPGVGVIAKPGIDGGSVVNSKTRDPREIRARKARQVQKAGKETWVPPARKAYRAKPVRSVRPGPQGPPGPEGPASKPLLPGMNSKKLALSRWYEFESSYDKNLINGGIPIGLARASALVFDGDHMWVAGEAPENSVTKVRVSDGDRLLAQSTFLKDPGALGFDGFFIWVASRGNQSVIKLRASNGSHERATPVDGVPKGFAFDGNHMWVAVESSGTGGLQKWARGGTPVGSFLNDAVSPEAVVFDGNHLWLADSGTDTVTKFRPSDGANLGSFAVGGGPSALAFDGQHIWVANGLSDTVTMLDASDGTDLGSFPVGLEPLGVLFDGLNVWVANAGSHDVTKLRAEDGAHLGTFSITVSQGAGVRIPAAIAFDGAYIWVASSKWEGAGVLSGGVSKH